MNNEQVKDLQPLSEEEIKTRLEDLPGWEYKDNKIFKTFEFPTFGDGISLVHALVPICNRLDHHPDIFLIIKKLPLL